jgi:anti-sigma B factor antagonist
VSLTDYFRREGAELALYMTHGRVEGVVVVWLVGRIVLGKETGALRKNVKVLFEEGYKKLVLNMDGVTFIDSAGLGALVALYYNANSCGASLRLCHLGSKFKDLLYITRLYTIFEISDTQADALRSFSE